MRVLTQKPRRPSGIRRTRLHWRAAELDLGLTVAELKRTDVVLDVTEYDRYDGDVIVKCPHCQRILGLPSGLFKGGHVQHRVCSGWLGVSYEARPA